MSENQTNTKRVTFFFDGQNLFRSVMESFPDYFHPNFDTLKLAKQVCKIQNEENEKGDHNEEWILGPVRFYTGVPRADKSFMWHTFWTKKLNLMKRQGIITITRNLHYLGDDDKNGREKGIDLRIGLDLVRLGRNKVYDIAVIFSQDQDLVEAVNDAKEQADADKCILKFYSAYPNSELSKNLYGIKGTRAIKLSKQDYDACIDPADYRPKQEEYPRLK